jgi:predicted small secreted protein
MVRTDTVTLSLLAAATSLTGCGSNQDGAVGRASGKTAGISAGYRGVHLVVLC